MAKLTGMYLLLGSGAVFVDSLTNTMTSSKGKLFCPPIPSASINHPKIHLVTIVNINVKYFLPSENLSWAFQNKVQLDQLHTTNLYYFRLFSKTKILNFVRIVAKIRYDTLRIVQLANLGNFNFGELHTQLFICFSLFESGPWETSVASW